MRWAICAKARRDIACQNEWAPVHESIAGPGIFVLAKDFWYTPVLYWDPASAWPLRFYPVDMLELSVARKG
jgi:hypothetical protein